MIYDRAKFERGKWRATVNATTYSEAVPAYIIKARHAIPALPFFRVV